MKYLSYGSVTGPVLGFLWCFTAASSVAVIFSFATGYAFRPSLSLSLLAGVIAGLGVIAANRLSEFLNRQGAALILAALLALLTYIGQGPVVYDALQVSQPVAVLACLLTG